jgi:putative redox protein
MVQKQRQQISRFAVTADSERDAEPPWRYKKIRILYQFAGPNLKAASIERAIQLTEAKYCSIYVTLRDAVEIQSDYEIVAG